MAMSSRKEIVESLTEVASNKTPDLRPAESRSYSGWYSISVDIKALNLSRDRVVAAFTDTINEAGLADELKGKFVIHVSKDRDEKRAITFLHQDEKQLISIVLKLKSLVADKVADKGGKEERLER